MKQKTYLNVIQLCSRPLNGTTAAEDVTSAVFSGQMLLT